MSVRPPELTICSLVNSPPARLAIGLGALRSEHAEVVLAVDDRMDPAWIDGYRALADRVLLVPYPGGLNYMYAWLVDQCSGRWIFYLEADEVPSPALIDELEATMQRDDVTHCLLPRRWLYPDPGSWLAQWPWRPDYQTRLIRNVPAVLRFPGDLHTHVLPVGARRCLREPLYHASLLLTDLEAREHKAQGYAAARPGLVIDGGPFNQVFYLPEHRPGLRIEAVPEEAAATVQAFVTADGVTTSRTSRRGPAGVSAHSAAEITFKQRRSLGEGAYEARLTLLDDDLRVVSGETRTFDVEVTNLGDSYWPGTLESHPRITVSSRWIGADGAASDGPRTPIGAPLHPGESALVPLLVSGPTVVGSHELEIDLVHEWVRWFGCRVRVRVEVRAALPG